MKLPNPIHKRTAFGQHEDGSFYLRATSQEDAGHIQDAAQKHGISLEHRKGPAIHQGQKGEFSHFHFEDSDHAQTILDELRTLGSTDAKKAGMEKTTEAEQVDAAAPAGDKHIHIHLHDGDEEPRAVQKAHHGPTTRTVDGKVIQVKAYDDKAKPHAALFPTKKDPRGPFAPLDTRSHAEQIGKPAAEHQRDVAEYEAEGMTTSDAQGARAADVMTGRAEPKDYYDHMVHADSASRAANKASESGDHAAAANAHAKAFEAHMGAAQKLHKTGGLPSGIAKHNAKATEHKEKSSQHLDMAAAEYAHEDAAIAHAETYEPKAERTGEDRKNDARWINGSAERAHLAAADHAHASEASRALTESSSAHNRTEEAEHGSGSHYKAHQAHQAAAEAHYHAAGAAMRAFSDTQHPNAEAHNALGDRHQKLAKEHFALHQAQAEAGEAKEKAYFEKNPEAKTKAAPANKDNWQPASGRTEKPFKARSGATLTYMHNEAKPGEHAYYLHGEDRILTNEEAEEHMKDRSLKEEVPAKPEQATIHEAIGEADKKTGSTKETYEKAADAADKHSKGLDIGGGTAPTAEAHYAAHEAHAQASAAAKAHAEAGGDDAKGYHGAADRHEKAANWHKFLGDSKMRAREKAAGKKAPREPRNLAKSLDAYLAKAELMGTAQRWHVSRLDAQNLGLKPMELPAFGAVKLAVIEAAQAGMEPEEVLEAVSLATGRTYNDAMLLWLNNL